jgi:hypothetical protein
MTKLRHDGGEKHFTDKIDNFKLWINSALSEEDKKKLIEERNKYFEENGYLIRRVDNREGAIVTYAIHPMLLEEDMSNTTPYIYSLLIILDEEKYDMEEFVKDTTYTFKEAE